jgi:hypothetical protein
MSIKFEKQDDGSFKRTGELPAGTEKVWIYTDGRRSQYVFQSQLALNIVEQCTAMFRAVKSYVLQPVYSNVDNGYAPVTPENIEGLVSLHTNILWPEVQRVRPSSDVNSALAILVSSENERLLKTSPQYVIQRDDGGKVLTVKCDFCEERFFVFYHMVSTVSPWDRKRMLSDTTVELREILGREHKLRLLPHPHDRPFEIAL